VNTNLHTELRGSVFRRLAAHFIIPASAAVSGGLRCAFDIEANGFLDTATTLHCVVIADLDSDRVDEYGPERIAAGLEHLARADYLVGHNILDYDLKVLHKLRGWAPKAGCTVVDTLITSRLILPHVSDLDDQAAAMGDPKLGQLRGRYSIEAWGLRLGMPKVGTDIENFSTFTSEMLERCVGDTAICKRLWQFLRPDGYSQSALELEHRVAPICSEITAAGMFFDADAAERLKQQWTARRGELEAQLQQQFPGTNLNSRTQIGALLEARGWVPEKRTEKTKQPVVDDELLETIATTYPEFAGLSEHYILGRRLGQLVNGKKAWSKSVSADGRIHGGIVHIGTPHSRAKHLEPNLAQVPNPKRGKPFATECRGLFKARDGWVLVACDQATLQDRGFAHYLTEFDGGAYGKDFLAGMDTHWRTATALGLAVNHERNKENKVDTVIREGSKGFRYAFLYGAGVTRAGMIVAGIVRAVRHLDPTSDLPQRFFGGETHPKESALKRVGRQALDKFEAATPGLRKLRHKLQSHAERHGWLPGLDGRRVPTRAQYSALNFIVTSSEAIICKRWLVRTYDELRAKFRYGWGGDVVICLWIHDEIVACCRPEIAKEVGEIMVRHAKEPGEFYDFKVALDADFKIGRNWAGEPVEGGAAARAPSIMPEPAEAPIVTPADSEELDHADDEDSAELGDDKSDEAPDDVVVETPIPGLADAIKGVQAFIAAAAAGQLKTATQSDGMPPWEGGASFGNTAVEAAPPEPPQKNGRAGGNGHAADGFDDFPEAKPGGKILCPFHDDHTPSLHVYPDEDDPHYHCFVCGAHGHLDDLEIDWETALNSPTGQPIDDDNARNLERAHELWDKAKPIGGTLAERYLAETRGIDIGALPPNIDDVLRFNPRCWLDGANRPCLIALFRDIETNERAGIHRTWLTADAQKIDRRMFGRWPRPRAIKLWPANDRLYVGEGIETVLAAATRLRMQPAWALGSRVYLEKLPIISGVDELTILVDRDPHGEAAGKNCYRSWKAAGRRVRRLRTQDASLNDFNDLVRAKLMVVVES
jgi:DNA polymerase I-like protein with 3'-5' exonuclease and polymerase domains